MKIALTPEQQEQAQQFAGKGPAALDLEPEELEERVAPSDIDHWGLD